jgi:putative heme-binding domain-containing protein
MATSRERIVRIVARCVPALLAATAALAGDGAPASRTLQEQLVAEGVEALAKAARERGDAARGARVFHRPTLACVKCHGDDGGKAPLGPDLTRLGRDTPDSYLVESILDPSKSIKKGFETVTVVTVAGKAVSGIVVEERPDAVVIREPTEGGTSVAVAKADIAERNDGGPSLMPAGLVNLLESRQEFLDLVRYLREVADHGSARARELRPDPAPLAPPPLPEYEKDLDHAGLIGALDGESFRRGEAIYDRVCVNCHGTRDRAGTLPTSLRFASGTFRNGSDPYSMYRTLTRGFGLMAPQPGLVPRQKYDVIHYIREAFLKGANPSQYVRVDRDYLARLPKGTTFGPEPAADEPWAAMDYGPSLAATYEVGSDGSNFAYKGVAARLDDGPGGVARGSRWLVFDHDTMRVAAAWSGRGFIDWNGINFNGKHQVHPRLVGRVHLANPNGPGWANPDGSTFDDPRPRGRDGRPYGPLPRHWARFKGQYLHGHRVILSYTVGAADVLESPGLEPDPAHPDEPIFARTVEVGRSPRDLWMRVAPAGTAVALAGDDRATLVEKDGVTLLHIPASATPMAVEVLMGGGDRGRLQAVARSSPGLPSLRSLTSGGPRRWPEVLKTRAEIGGDGGPFAVDILNLPEANPWRCQVRPTGFDFLDGGRRAAVCTWDGDVWLVSGLDDPAGGLSWQRFATGLFQPLGLKVLDGKIFVGCRDQIAILHDRNSDGEADFYECFNSDHQVTEHFHEFAMGLQADADGNLYYAKAARHGLPAVVPQHGTLLRVRSDGARTDILATGFRAPNGVCLNPDGTFFLTDQEGFWTPKNRINHVKAGAFYGNMWGYHDVTDASDAAMEPPVCWITNAFDRSPAELLWVRGTAWSPLEGSLLNLSYGEGKVFVVPHEAVGGVLQGGMAPLPIPPFPTGVMRGRFHPRDGQLYACGMFAWAGNRTQPGGFYRVRYTGKPVYAPVGLHARRGEVALTFSAPLEHDAASDPRHFAVKVWSLRRSVRYGSEHHDERALLVASASPSEDGRTVTLGLPEVRPSWCMEIKYALKGARGEDVVGAIHNTIHRLPD